LLCRQHIPVSKQRSVADKLSPVPKHFGHTTHLLVIIYTIFDYLGKSVFLLPTGTKKRLPHKASESYSWAHPACQKLVSCHPEFISGSHNTLILLDAETSSA